MRFRANCPLPREGLCHLDSGTRQIWAVNNFNCGNILVPDLPLLEETQLGSNFVRHHGTWITDSAFCIPAGCDQPVIA